MGQSDRNNNFFSHQQSDPQYYPSMVDGQTGQGGGGGGGSALAVTPDDLSRAVDQVYNGRYSGQYDFSMCIVICQHWPMPVVAAAPLLRRAVPCRAVPCLAVLLSCCVLLRVVSCCVVPCICRAMCFMGVALGAQYGNSLTHSVAHSVTHALTHSLTRSLTQSLVH